jgi:hypothetical protein
VKRAGFDTVSHECSVVELFEAPVDDHNVMVVFELFAINFDKTVNGVLEGLNEGIIVGESLLELGFLVAHRNCKSKVLTFQ